MSLKMSKKARIQILRNDNENFNPANNNTVLANGEQFFDGVKDILFVGDGNTSIKDLYESGDIFSTSSVRTFSQLWQIFPMYDREVSYNNGDVVWMDGDHNDGSSFVNKGEKEIYKRYNGTWYGMSICTIDTETSTVTPPSSFNGVSMVDVITYAGHFRTSKAYTDMSGFATHIMVSVGKQPTTTTLYVYENLCPSVYYVFGVLEIVLVGSLNRCACRYTAWDNNRAVAKTWYGESQNDSDNQTLLWSGWKEATESTGTYPSMSVGHVPWSGITDIINANGPSTVRIGKSILSSADDAVAIGNSTSIFSRSVAIGNHATTKSTDSVAIGNGAKVDGVSKYAIQLGQGTNGNARTLSFGVPEATISGQTKQAFNRQIVDGDGNIHANTSDIATWADNVNWANVANKNGNNGPEAIAIGKSASADTGSTAIGVSAVADKQDSMQLGTGTTTSARSLYFGVPASSIDGQQLWSFNREIVDMYGNIHANTSDKATNVDWGGIQNMSAENGPHKISLGSNSSIVVTGVDNAIAIGDNSTIAEDCDNGLAIGAKASVKKGTYGATPAIRCVAIGYGAKVSGSSENTVNSVQIGEGELTTSNTLQFRNVKIANDSGVFATYTHNNSSATIEERLTSLGFNNTSLQINGVGCSSGGNPDYTFEVNRQGNYVFGNASINCNNGLWTKEINTELFLLPEDFRPKDQIEDIPLVYTTSMIYHTNLMRIYENGSAQISYNLSSSGLSGPNGKFYMSFGYEAAPRQASQQSQNNNGGNSGGGPIQDIQ